MFIIQMYTVIFWLFTRVKEFMNFPHAKQNIPTFIIYRSNNFQLYNN